MGGSAHRSSHALSYSPRRLSATIPGRIIDHVTPLHPPPSPTRARTHTQKGTRWEHFLY
ncbi:hypothetical protein T492DRAFT_1017551 [Pavlovales sp. CCMP2436]|nr:hypothetical protein T492DRAFT_1017551 [Pavlovales sp. CCMP2436]